MAYLDTGLGTGAGLSEGLAGIVSAEAALSPLERRTLQLSRADGRASLRPPRRIERIDAMLFGSQRVSGLANPRLEALRRFAILYRLDGACLDSHEVARAEAAGLSAAMLDRVRHIVDGWPRRAGLLGRAASLIAAVGLAMVGGAAGYFWLADELDPMVAAILLGAVVATLAPLFGAAPRR